MPRGRRSVQDEFALRAEIERRLRIPEKLYSIAKALGCSITTVRKYRDEVHKTLPAADGVQRIVQSADKVPESVQSVVQVAKAAPKSPHSFRSGETVLHNGVWRYVTAVHLNAQTLNLRQVTGTTWEQTDVPFASVKPMHE